MVRSVESCLSRFFVQSDGRLVGEIKKFVVFVHCRETPMVGCVELVGGDAPKTTGYRFLPRS